MYLTISHTTRYRYERPPEHGLQRVRLIPRSGPSQTVRKWAVSTTGATVEAEYDDHYGNRVMLLSIDPDGRVLEVGVRGEVETVDRTGMLGPHRASLPLWVYRRETDLTAPGEGVAALTAAFEGYDGNGLSLLHALSARIADAVAYRKDETDAATTAEDALAQGSGVCQDQAHVFLAAARALGFPARYVGGYLSMDDRVEQEAGHAWAEAHVEGLGWIGFDISNRMCPDDRYVRVATGLDYHEAAPVAGLSFGGAGESLEVTVQVQRQSRGQSQSQSQS